MNGLPAADDSIKEIDACITETKTNHEERVSYMTYEMKMREAHDDGRAEGRAEGRIEGERNADLRIAKRMLAKNKSIEEIIELVNLSREEVEELSLQSK